MGMINQKRAEREEHLENIKNTLGEKVGSICDHMQIEGRVKHFYSIYKNHLLSGQTMLALLYI
jgi:(p)ppGpp synthase/HD superfamily hydrolase